MSILLLSVASTTIAYTKEIKSATIKSENIVVFGDSLSDAGYQDILPNNYPDWPNMPTKQDPKQPTFTSPVPGNTVWPQYLVADYDFKAAILPNNQNTPPQNVLSVDGKMVGNDYAAGGATTTCTGIGLSKDNVNYYTPPPIGPLREGQSCNDKNIENYNEIDNYLSQHNNKADPNDIYIIFGGANNAFRDMNADAMKSAASDIVFDADYLVSKGAIAKNIYIVNLPNLGLTPLATGTGTADAMTVFSNTFNNMLNSLLDSKSYNLVDFNSFLNEIVKNKQITIGDHIYPFSNVTDGLCKSGQPNDPNALICIPDLSKEGASTYLFEGNIHPTTYTHKVFAKYLKNVIDKTQVK